MPKSPPASAQGGERRRVGKDHLNLADWRISVPTYQQPRKKNGGKIDYVEYVIDRSNGTRQRVTLEASSKTGLPTASDEDVIIALLYFAKQQGFASDVVRFVPTQLLNVMRWPIKTESYVRLKHALKRLRAVTVTYESTWYCRKVHKIEPVLITGMLAEAELVVRRGRRAAGAEPESYVQWTKNFYDSLKNGNLTNLDLDLYFSWKRPGTRHLYRHLNKVWHGGKKPKPYERDLRELACGHLGMTDCKDLKRNFHQLVEELERHSYLQPLAADVRYRKVRPGVWRVRMDLHPDHLPANRQAARPQRSADLAKEPQFDAAALVGEYHRQRFNRVGNKPTAKEIEHASLLLSNHQPEQVQRLIPKVAATMRQQFGDDLYFGAAVRTFEGLLADQDKQHRSRKRDREDDTRRRAEEEAVEQRKRERQQRRESLLVRWRKLSPQQRRACQEAACDRAPGSVVRRRLARAARLDEPAMEILEEMERRSFVPRGESASPPDANVPAQMPLWM